MNTNFHELIPADFADSSRVWIYQANRPFTLHEVLQIDELLEDFASHWLSHGAEVKGFAKVFFGQFIVIMADEEATGVSGCSTDSSVKLIKNIEQDFTVDLFNRQLLAFNIHERIQLFPLNELDSVIEKGELMPETLYFNNTVLTKKEFIWGWIIPINQSWLATRLTSMLRR